MSTIEFNPGLQQNEEWRKIPGYPNYSVSSLGNVRRDRVGYSRLLRQTLNDGGYYTVPLCQNANSKTMAVSRLVAGAFIPNPAGKPTVDHIDRIRTNNRVTNLRWATYCEQGLNRKCALGGSGHRHITAQYGGFKFQLKRSGKIIAAVWSKSLEEALLIRDEFLACMESGSGSEGDIEDANLTESVTLEV